MRWVAGVDEAGVGPLAGPVVAAAVILRRGVRIDGLDDSKRLSPKKRVIVAEQIRQSSLAFAVGRADVMEIDDLNVLRAAWLAMQRAVAALTMAPTQVLVDGQYTPVFPCPARAIVHGDATVAEIMAASVLAKVARDEEMCAWDSLYPQYGFAVHKGYGTARHLAVLKEFGPCPLHRNSFAPVRVCVREREGT